MTRWISSPSIEQDDSAVLRLSDLRGGDVIDPSDYAEAIARSIPAKLVAVSVRDEQELLYEVWVNNRMMARLPKDQAISFLDGVIVGTKLSRDSGH